MAELRAGFQRQLSVGPTDALSGLVGSVHPTDGRFRLISRLSGGGVVVRVLDCPQTERPLFGDLRADGFRLARVTRGVDIAPFEPIADGTIETHAGGARLNVSLAPHGQARSFALAHAAAGAMLLTAAAVKLSSDPLIAGLCVVLALVFFIFPSVRARLGFTRGCAALEAELDLALGCAGDSRGVAGSAPTGTRNSEG